jgi:predicted nucleic acid-binding protein
MTDRVFVDTNVLVYSRDTSRSAKQEIAAGWMETLWASGTGRTSVQVLNEFFVTVTGKLSPGLERGDAWADVQDLMSWEPQPVDRVCTEYAFHLHNRYSLSWWDALVVSAARLQQCPVLLTEDLQEDAEYDGVRVVNPFAGILHPEADGPMV